MFLLRDRFGVFAVAYQEF